MRRYFYLVMIACFTLILSPITSRAAKEEEAAYGIGSVSKIFTAAAVMKLADEKKLDLDTPVVNYIQDFKMKDERYKDITPRMLLNHSSGLQGSTFHNVFLYADNDTEHHDTLLTVLSKQRLKAAPGEFSVYCNDGFTLAEILIERVTGMRFTDYMQENFWASMNLSNIKTPLNASEFGKIADVYLDHRNMLPVEYCNAIGSGGIMAAAADLALAGQVFTNTKKEGYTILSSDAKQAMMQEEYKKGLWSYSDSPSSLSFGLGWDSVSMPEFTKYGIRALHKGGDQINYHASLMVLPDYNISCSVLSSGGSSQLNSLAAQEIILAYLEELQEIKRQEEDTVPASPQNQIEVPDKYLNYSGWYASKGLYRVEIQKEGTLMLSSLGSSRDTVQRYLFDGIDSFLSTEGNFITMDGTLSSPQNGITGNTKLTFREGTDGGIYITMNAVSNNPRLGLTKMDAPFAQKISEESLTPTEERLWKERDGKEYYIANEKYTSANYAAAPCYIPMIIDELPGYLLFKNHPLGITKIADAYHSRFFQTLPGQAGRDLKDIHFYKEEGSPDYFMTDNMKYVSGNNMESFAFGNGDVVISESGETIWFKIDESMTNRTVTIASPANGNFFLYSMDEEGLDCTYTSLLGNKKELVLPAGGRIAFAGEPGAEFSIGE